MAESRLRYDAARAEAELVSDRSDGPHAGVHRFSVLEFIARWVDHVPERYEVRVRYCGAYATRRRVWWHRRGVTLARARDEPTGVVEREDTWPALRARRRRWAELLRMVFREDVELCPRCGGAARIIGFVTQPTVVGRLLAHLAQRGVDARAGPWTGAAAAPG
ncbi:MAG: transposase [Candidatus Eisenbacteria bacterium]|nr:transposase [Candidatus Eisenbacteria bacterium]